MIRFFQNRRLKSMKSDGSCSQVKADGALIGELDLFHHRPYECLLLGYCYKKVSLCSVTITINTFIQNFSMLLRNFHFVFAGCGL